GGCYVCRVPRMTSELTVEQVRDMSPEERARWDARVESQVVRFRNVRPNWLLSPNCRIPGYERANFVYVGVDWSAEGDLRAPLPEGENYSLTILLCAPGKGAPLHAHTTEETFFAL